jgi:hypothetical protein
MIVRFKKYEDETGTKHWYLYEPTWRGEREDLKLPSTLSSLIVEEVGVSTEDISFELAKYHLDDAKILEKIHNEEMESGRYDSYYGEVYICDLLQLYFPEGYPNKIYYRIHSDDKR